MEERLNDIKLIPRNVFGGYHCTLFLNFDLDGEAIKGECFDLQDFADLIGFARFDQSSPGPIFPISMGKITISEKNNTLVFKWYRGYKGHKMDSEDIEKFLLERGFMRA